MPTHRGRILLVDDNRAIADALRAVLQRHLYYTCVAYTRQEAFEEIVRDQFDVMVVDWVLPDGSGREVLDFARQNMPDASLIVHSAFETSDAEATVCGAHQFVPKGTTSEQIRNAIERGLLKARSARGKTPVRDSLESQNDSRFLEALLEELSMPEELNGHLGLSSIPGGVPDVLVEWFCDPDLAGHPLGRFNCRNVSAESFQRRVFGQAMLGGNSKPSLQRGLAEVARGGTLYLRNIDCVDEQQQERLAEAAAANRIRRVGSDRDIEVSFRLVVTVESADARMPVHDRLARRLQEVVGSNWIRLPRIRDLRDGGFLLVSRLLRDISTGRQYIGPAATWVLRNLSVSCGLPDVKGLVERAHDRCSSDRVEIEDLAMPVLETSIARMSGTERRLVSWERMRELLEAFYFSRLLSETCGNVTRATEISGIGRQAFYRKIRKHGILPDAFKERSQMDLFGRNTDD